MTKPDIKAVFLDIDGTILSHTNFGIPKSTIQALHALRENGIKVIIATGRSTAEMQELPLEDMDYDALILLNGQMGLEKDGTLFLDKPLSGLEKEQLLDLFNNKEHLVVLMLKDRQILNGMTPEVEAAHEQIHVTVPPVEEYAGQPVYMGAAFGTAEEQEMMKKGLGALEVTNWGPVGIDIVSPNAGKSAGMKTYLEKHDIDISQAMAVGDGENDISMIQDAGVGVAMGNSSQKVKDAADYVAGHIDEDGLAGFFKEYGLIE